MVNKAKRPVHKLNRVVHHFRKGNVVGERKVPNKMLKELRETQAGVQKLATALGFDPGSRSRLGLAEVKARNELEDLIARRNVN